MGNKPCCQSEPAKQDHFVSIDHVVCTTTPLSEQTTENSTVFQAVASAKKDREIAEALEIALQEAEAAQQEAQTILGRYNFGASPHKRMSNTSEAATSSEFTVTLINDKNLAPWGLTLLRSIDGNQLAMGLISGQAASEWQENNQDKQVLPGDEIISLNGVSGNAETLITEMGKSSVLDIVLRRTLIFTAEVIRSTTLGLSFDPSSFKVTKIHIDSPASHYNRQANPNVMIFKGDELCGVNGMMSSSHDLLHQMKSFKRGDTARLVFKRPAVPSSQDMVI